MTAPPMRPWQNLLALLGAIVASGALLPLPSAVRFACIAFAVAVILLMVVVRLRSHRVRRDDAAASSVYERIERIRAQRGGRRRTPR